LKHFVWANFDARDEIGRAGGKLLNLLKIIDWVLVQLHDSNFDEWKVLLTPDLCQIEGVELVAFSLLECHDLDVQSPGEREKMLNKS